MKKLSLAALVVVLAACTPQGDSPDYIAYGLLQKYKGHPVADFVQNYGYPSAMNGDVNGTRLYSWNSAQYSGRLKLSDVASYAPAAENYHSADSYHGHTERHYCELRIYADASDMIRNIVVAVDSTGLYSTSRCSEIFD